MTLIPIHTKPRMMPASAIPLPCCVPPDRSIWFLAMNPKTIARIEVIPVQGMIPRISDAIANPFVLDVVGAPAPYEGAAGCGGGGGGGAGPRSGSCGGVAVIVVPPSPGHAASGA